MIKTKLKALNDFLIKHKDAPEQGSQAWLDSRGIGGSELNRLLKDEKGLVANKIGLTKIPDMLPMRWGSVLEETLRDTVALIFRTSIYETSSVPSAEVTGKTYSMDGMGLVRFLMDEWNGQKYEHFQYLMTLFEFKCAFSRKIVQGEVYRDYIPQVLSGMCDLALPEISIYVEGVHRICRHEDLCNTPDIEEWLHRAGNPEGLLPMSYGFVGFYMPRAQIPDDPEANCLFDWMQNGCIDFAKLGSQMMLNRLFKFTKTKDIGKWQSNFTYQRDEFKRCPYFAAQKIKLPNQTIDMDEELMRFYAYCRKHGYFPLGTLGIKLLDINVVAVEKQHGYTKQYESEIHTALEKINYLKTFEDMDERRKEYNKMYEIPEDPEENALAAIDQQTDDDLSAYVAPTGAADDD